MQELFEPLQLMYNSLVSTGDESTANHRLLDMLRQVTTFGLSLMKLDIRQESTRHAEVCQHGFNTSCDFYERFVKGRRLPVRNSDVYVHCGPPDCSFSLCFQFSLLLYQFTSSGA
jgi:hypothetical protein